MADADTDIETRRAEMVRDIENEAKVTARHTGRERFAQRVLDAIAGVPRHKFVRDDDQYRAYANGPLPIGQGQTISQPFIVALMADVLDLSGAERVLEIGGGSGYHTAVLAKLAAHVFSIEIVPTLAHAATARLTDLGVANVTVRTADGNLGWPEEAPFDAILVAAAPTALPEALVHQLKAPGRMVVPVGRGRIVQELLLVTKDAAGNVSSRNILPVAFVPLVKG